MRRSNPITRKLCYRLYLATMRFEHLSYVSVRRWLMNKMLGRRHQRLNIFADVFVDGVEGLTLGDDVSINRASHLSAAGGLAIGNFVSIGHGTSILTGEHGYGDPQIPIKYQPVEMRPVRIGSNIWIGANVTILAGVEIADGTVIAAGAVVTKSVTEPDTIVAGIPAKMIKYRLAVTTS